MFVVVVTWCCVTILNWIFWKFIILLVFLLIWEVSDLCDFGNIHFLLFELTCKDSSAVLCSLMSQVLHSGFVVPWSLLGVKTIWLYLVCTTVTHIFVIHQTGQLHRKQKNDSELDVIGKLAAVWSQQHGIGKGMCTLQVWQGRYLF